MALLKNPLLFFLLFSVCNFTHASFKELKDFGENPGELTAHIYTPEHSYTAVVVLLHGCIQNGVELAKQSGLFGLAQENNFALLIPQQSTNNNAKACFNWFSSQDTNVNQGESLSLKNMVLSVSSQQPNTKTYIVGLSAGAAMSTMMLVNYPNLFTAGAIVSGIPFPCAKDLIQAISCMQNGPSENGAQLAKQALALSSTQATWPSLSIWTGVEDKIVHPKNAKTLANQWSIMTNINSPPTTIKHNGYTRTTWQGSNKTSIELFEIELMGHGLAVNPNLSNGGNIGPYLLKAPLSTMIAITEYWKLK
jgi:poly(hydroxyalkanoate) depolymerase family esterase